MKIKLIKLPKIDRLKIRVSPSNPKLVIGISVLLLVASAITFSISLNSKEANAQSAQCTNGATITGCYQETWTAQEIHANAQDYNGYGGGAYFLYRCTPSTWPLAGFGKDSSPVKKVVMYCSNGHNSGIEAGNKYLTERDNTNGVTPIVIEWQVNGRIY